MDEGFSIGDVASVATLRDEIDDVRYSDELWSDCDRLRSRIEASPDDALTLVASDGEIECGFIGPYVPPAEVVAVVVVVPPPPLPPPPPPPPPPPALYDGGPR